MSKTHGCLCGITTIHSRFSNCPNPETDPLHTPHHFQWHMELSHEEQFGASEEVTQVTPYD